jgi:hypothetical protein
MVGGEIVVQDGKLAGATNAELKQAAEAARARMEAEVKAVDARNRAIMDALLQAHEQSENFSLPYDRFSIRR